MASGYTLAEARIRVARSFLDDRNYRRYAESEIDEHLQQSIDDCRLELRTELVIDRFTEEEEVTTTSAGVVDLSTLTYPVASIEGVSAKYGAAWQPVHGIDPGQAEREDTTERTLRIYYSPAFTVPTNTAHPLVGSGATRASGTSRTFEEWVMLESALKMLSLKDPKSPRLSFLRDQASRARTRNLEEIVGPRAKKFPKPGVYAPALFWYYEASANQLRLSRRLA